MPEDAQEEEQEEVEEESQAEMYSPDDEIKKLPLGKFFQKEMFTGEGLTVALYGLGKNQFGKPIIEIEVDGELGVLNINSANQNQLVNFFGSKIKDWIGKKIHVKAEYKEYDSLTPGYTLTFSKVA